MLRLSRELISSPLGRIFVITDEDNYLRAVDWQTYEKRLMQLLDRHYGKQGFQLNSVQEQNTSTAAAALQAYFEGDSTSLDGLQVRTGGTSFQKQVWAALRTIPYGKTLTYGDLAKQIENPKAVRAVGLANGANPIVIAVPCHRVIGANGKLTGYAGGVEKKKWLLEHEGAIPASLPL